MDENKKKKWSEISEEIADVSQNIKNKIEEEDVIDDLKESFDNVLQNTSEVIKNLLNAIETTVQDTSLTILSSDPNWDFDGDMEFTSGGLTIEDGDTTGTYTYSGNQLILTDDNGDSETATAVVTSTSLTVTLEETEVNGDANNNSTMVTKMVLNCTRK